ncbi:PEP-utilizing protein [Kroppenstedtia pulmonis]|uniref:PEP-utilizing protein n=1 Tax=Kroppenstedtia pulmonis TaxID=1380685 RepID=A0A7D3Y6A9_9BACL|nr:PEP-utilizing enzyme [Kroppenstedtia pulmonis]QKG85505.1 PEP-utilizing protein [Kroppenstedtia pulmonis]
MKTPVITEFQRTIILSEDEKQSGFWIQDDTHFSDPKTPLFLSFMLPAFLHGANKAFKRWKYPIDYIALKSSEGYVYQTTIPAPGDPAQQFQEQLKILRPLFPSLKERLYQKVEDILLPTYEKIEANSRINLSLKDALQKTEELYDFYLTAWEIHFDVVLPQGVLHETLEQLYKNLTKSDDVTFLHEMLTGVMNKFLESDQKLWELAEQAKKNQTLSKIFLHSPANHLQSELSQADDGQDFLSLLAPIIREYGYRKLNNHEFIGETWVENIHEPLSIIQTFIQKDYHFQKEFNHVRTEREHKYRQLLDRLPDSEQKEEFKQVYQWALKATCLRDDHHFYIDAMLPAKARLLLLNVGKTMVLNQIMENPEDIFFLYLDEVQQALSKPEPLTPLISKRQEEYRTYQKKKAPASYGTPSEAQLSSPMLQQIMGSIKETLDDTNRLKGFAASRGKHTGIVKVIHGPDDASKLEKGDILVCKTTTPTWTVMFAVAGAVVTDAGGVLSHSGIVAREYQIPAVVGTKVATTNLKDGDMITVDGTNGVVTIEKQK